MALSEPAGVPYGAASERNQHGAQCVGCRRAPRRTPTAMPPARAAAGARHLIAMERLH
jgi:hypothetical protein